MGSENFQARPYCIHCFKTLDPMDREVEKRSFVKCSNCGIVLHEKCQAPIGNCPQCLSQVFREFQIVTAVPQIKILSLAPSHFREEHTYRSQCKRVVITLAIGLGLSTVIGLGIALFVTDRASQTGNGKEDKLTPITMSVNSATASSSTAIPTVTSPETNTSTPMRTPTHSTLIAPVFISRNSDWVPVERTLNDIPMVLVPPGCFMMGSDMIADEKPIHEQCFDTSFWMDKTEVTQSNFVRLGGLKAQPNNFEGANKPVENITWFEAQNYCTLRGGHLPTEAEWEYAARGPDSLIYPWGNQFEPNNSAWNQQGTSDAGSYQGASWVGALDLTGNVWEWTNSMYMPYPYQSSDGRENSPIGSDQRVLRGGSWHTNFNPEGLRAADRSGVNPSAQSNETGFRCMLTDMPLPITDTPTLTWTPLPPTQAVLLGDTGNPVTSNSQWTPVMKDFNGVRMVKVPSGCFMMGTGDADIAQLNAFLGREAFSDEAPQNQVCFDRPFWIDQTEVTQATFRQFGGSKNYPNQFSGDYRPVETISWLEANAFCALRGARLPTEAEREYAARGADSWLYPWGNEWNPDQLVWAGNSNSQTADVGSYLGGASWVGALDMSGNVWEWVYSIYKPYPYQTDDGRDTDTGNNQDIGRVLRGGSWADGYPSFLRTAFRSRYIPSYASSGLGFRCASDFVSSTPVSVSPNSASDTTSTAPQITCDGSLPSRLVPSYTARVTPGGVASRLHSGPGINFEQIGILQPTKIFTVLDVPTCADGYAWYSIDFNGTQGWIAEGNNTEYWLEPIGEQPSTITKPQTTATPQNKDISTPTYAAFQQFEKGIMIWLEYNNRIYVVYNSGSWASYASNANGSESNTNLVPPAGLVQPIRGFGNLWRSNATIQANLGWGLAAEFGYQSHLTYTEATDIRTIVGPTSGTLVLDGKTHTWVGR